MAQETGQVTGTKDKDYNLIWFTEACLNNALRLETYVQDAERDGDNDLAEFFRRAQAESRKGADQGKQMLAQRLSGCPPGRGAGVSPPPDASLRRLWHLALDPRVDPEVVERPDDDGHQHHSSCCTVQFRLREVAALVARDHTDHQPDDDDHATDPHAAPRSSRSSGCPYPADTRFTPDGDHGHGT